MRFRNATDFRKSLEARLWNQADKKGIDLQRLRRQVAFDRFLGRIFAGEPPLFYLKGGYAMELRFARARATRDLDLTTSRMIVPGEQVIEELHQNLLWCTSTDLGDFFFFRIDPPRMELTNAPYGGARFPVDAVVDDRRFVSFHLDVAVERPPETYETLRTTNWLDFCGVDAPEVRMISVEQQFAEKLHAYTVPHGSRVNTRVKDLVDMLFLVRFRSPDREGLNAAIRRVFKQREGCTPPVQFPDPPSGWEARFGQLADECGIEATLEEAIIEVREAYETLVGEGVSV